MQKTSKLFLVFFLTIFLSVSLSPQAFSANNNLSDEELLNLIQKKCFNFFWNESNPDNGLVRDKTFNFRAGGESIASIASVGFALTAYPIGVERGWIRRQEAYDRTVKTLRFFRDHVEQVEGFFYHFVDMETGRRAWRSEVSSIDTALFLAGALFASVYFKSTEVERLANEIYDRVDFPWMMNRGRTLSMGWKPEGKFLRNRWNGFDEGLLLYFLAIGSPVNSIPADTWRILRRRVMAYGPYILIASPQLFAHQYPQCWFDLRGVTDGFANYFENSVSATLANREFCIRQSHRHRTYSENIWGLTASDGPSGYKAYGSEPGGALHDGTVAPTGAISSMAFTPELSIRVAREIFEKHKENLWGRYGFVDSFNFEKDWRSPYVTGINLGSMLLSIENYRTGFVWKNFMKLDCVQKAMREIGFRKGKQRLTLPPPPAARAFRRQAPIEVDGVKLEWKGVPVVYLDVERFIDYGEFESRDDLTADFSFQWDEENLYFYVHVEDDDVVSTREQGEIYWDDLVEIFFDPGEDGFKWNDPKNFQFGFNPGKEGEEFKTWLWPQGYDPVRSGNRIRASVIRDIKGYNVEAAIPWSLIGLSPEEGLEVRISPSVHDYDRNGSEGKLNWHFSQKDGESFELGRIVLQHPGPVKETETSTESHAQVSTPDATAARMIENQNTRIRELIK